MRSLPALLLSLTLIGCSAREDFESDLTATGVIFGLSEMGACAEVEFLAGTYNVEVWAVPARLCASYSKPTHSEYLESVRPELSAMVRIAEKYRTANCESQYNAFAVDPVTTATNAGHIVTAATFPNYRWFPLVEGTTELQNTMTTTWGLTDGSTARMGRYEEFISFMASRYMRFGASGVCLTELDALTQSFHPGWHFQTTKDTVEHPPVIINGICQYGSPASPLCTTLGPQF